MLWENTSFERCPDPQTNGDHAICHWNWISWLAIQHNKRNETRLVLPASARRTWLRKLTSQTIPPLAKELQNVITAHAFLCLDKLGACIWCQKLPMYEISSGKFVSLIQPTFVHFCPDDWQNPKSPRNILAIWHKKSFSFQNSPLAQ